MKNVYKRKILIFTIGGVGGAERMCVNIAKILNSNEFCVQIVVVGTMNSIYNIIPEDLDVDCIPLHNIYCMATLRIWWKIVTYKPDVVFSSLALLNMRTIIAAKLAGRQIIVRSSSMVSNYKKRTYMLLRLIYPFADKLIAQQEDMRQEISKKMNIPLSKIFTLQNPINTENINSLKNSPSPFPSNGGINYVNVARISETKGQDILIKAFVKVKRENPNAHLWFIGVYSEKNSYFQKLVNLSKTYNLDDCIHFVGYDKNPFRWTNHADCFVLPSRQEGLPNALIEASYIGVPCVATKCLDMISQIIKDGYNGYIVPVDDVDGMAEAMIKSIYLKNFEMIYNPSKPEEFVNAFSMVCK